MLESLRDVVSVSAGRDFSCAAVESGNVYTWGHPEVSLYSTDELVSILLLLYRKKETKKEREACDFLFGFCFFFF